jgi:hypothetical protein
MLINNFENMNICTKWVCSFVANQLPVLTTANNARSSRDYVPKRVGPDLVIYRDTTVLVYSQI